MECSFLACRRLVQIYDSLLILLSDWVSIGIGNPQKEEKK